MTSPPIPQPARRRLPDDLAAVLVEMRDRRDPRLRQMMHRARLMGWPLAALAPILGVTAATVAAQIRTVGDYDPTLLPAVPAPPTQAPKRLLVLKVTPPPAQARTGKPVPPGAKSRRGMPVDQIQLAARLRAAGCTWVQIAAELRREFDLNQLAAMRIAHGWSQNDLADRWNRRWPTDRKTFKTLSYWERWSAGEPTGHTPGIGALARLAELFECSLTDLLDRYGDFRHLDQAGPGELVDGHHQYTLGQVCPHGCTVLAYTPAPNGDGGSG